MIWNFDEIEVYQTDIADYDSLALVEQYIPDLIYGHNAMLGDRQRGEFGYFQNVGHFGEEGSVVFSNNTYTCDGAGFRLWGTSDQFQYTYRLVANDTEIGGQVLSVENVSDDAKAGLMLREYPSSEACYIAALFRPGGVLQIQARTVSGGETQTLATKSDGWRWVMLQRDGDIFKAFYRKDSFASWVNLCGTNIAMRNVICSGLAVSSRDNDVGCSTVYTNIWTLDDF
jgi:hypothetical protein